LKLLDAYRYPQTNVFDYNNLLQQILLKHCWQNRFEVRKVVNAINAQDDYSDSDEEIEKKDEFEGAGKTCPITKYIERFFMLQNVDSQVVNQHVRKSPYFFHLLNQVLCECYFSPRLETQILEYSKFFMAQPLPNGLIPLETNRILLNERIMPGITKILLIARDFPQLNIKPGSSDLADPQKMNIIHQHS